MLSGMMHCPAAFTSAEVNPGKALRWRPISCRTCAETCRAKVTRVQSKSLDVSVGEGLVRRAYGELVCYEFMLHQSLCQAHTLLGYAPWFAAACVKIRRYRCSCQCLICFETCNSYCGPNHAESCTAIRKRTHIARYSLDWQV